MTIRLLVNRTGTISSPSVARTTTRSGLCRLVRPGTEDTRGRNSSTPALFVWPTWQVSHQRLPPRFDVVRLELGVIAKVIPSGQVMEGRGPIALRTAAWETRCHRYSVDGAYLSVREWLADDGARWRQAIAEVREACGAQIGTTFGQSVIVLLRLYGPLQPWFDKTWKPGDFELLK